MDSQGATVPELIEWFISIRQERSKLVAENNNETNADLVGCSTAAMHAVMKKILLLTQGKLVPPAPAATPSNLFCVRLRHRFGNYCSFETVLHHWDHRVPCGYCPREKQVN